MAQVNINNIIIKNNPSTALQPFEFDITFQCFNELAGNFDWQIIYIGSPTNSHYDQIIDNFDMNDLKVGVMNFTVSSNPPNFANIPNEQIVGTTAIIISVSYQKQQFFRCGYYVRNQYPEELLNNMDIVPQLKDLHRYILADSPRIFRFEIQWAKQQGQPQQDNQLLQQNINMMGGDPFESTNGALQQLNKLSYAEGMFNNMGSNL